MDKLVARSALGAWGILRPGIEAMECSAQALLRVQVQARTAEQLDTAVCSLAGVPPAPGEVRGHGSQHWFWTAPGNWLIATPEQEAPALLRTLRESLCAQLAAVDVVTDSRLQLEFRGRNVRELFSRASTLDFHPDAFPVRGCALCRFAGIQVLLACPQQEGDFLLIAERTAAHYLGQWLEAASVDL